MEMLLLWDFQLRFTQSHGWLDHEMWSHLGLSFHMLLTFADCFGIRGDSAVAVVKTCGNN